MSVCVCNNHTLTSPVKSIGKLKQNSRFETEGDFSISRERKKEEIRERFSEHFSVFDRSEVETDA